MDTPAPLLRAPRIDGLAAELVASIWNEPSTRHLDVAPPPSREAVVRVLEQLHALLFPGYVGRQDIGVSCLAGHVTALVAAIRHDLAAQVRAARREAAASDLLESGPGDVAEVIVDRFLATLPAIRAMLATDIRAAYEGDPAASSTGEVILSYPGVFAIATYRLAHELYTLEVPLIPRIMTEHAHARTGVDIHPGATIGEAFFIDHGTGVVIGETTVIGRRVRVYQGVTLGALSTRGGQTLRGVKRHPTIDDDVTIYAGASILGGDTVIGAGAVVASNVFITQSVPAHTRVSARNPELQYRDRRRRVLKQEPALDWSI